MAEINAIPWNGYRVVSTFSGCGGSCLGYRMAGFKVLWANEFVEEAQDTYRANAAPSSFLDCRDIRTVQPQEILDKLGINEGELDLFDGSPPCFAAGTPTLTMRGVVPIENVVVGDLVLTHKGRWRKVISTMSRKSETVLVEGRIECTPDHRFYAREQTHGWDADFGTNTWELKAPDWIDAKDLSGTFCATPVSFPISSPPDFPDGFSCDADFWYAVGRWVGDGWLRLKESDTTRVARSREPQRSSPVPCMNCGKPSAPNRRVAGAYTNYCSSRCRNRFKSKRGSIPRYEVHICTGHDDAKVLESKLKRLGVAVGRSTQDSTDRFTISRKSLARWLNRWFGQKAHAKTLPGWIFGMKYDHRKAFLDGYLDADGHEGRVSTSVSRCLSTGIAILAGTLGKTISIGKHVRRSSGEIDGRKINQRDAYCVRMNQDDFRYTTVEDGWRWRKIRKSVVPHSVENVVYDIEVEEDHSFVADIFAVHNCASFSTAGLGSEKWGTPKAYSTGKTQVVDNLFFEYTRILRGLKPKVFVAENVSGLVKGEAKGYFKNILAELKACGYKVESSLIDASWLGVPQRRQRIIFVGVRDDLPFSPVFPKPFRSQVTVREAVPWIDEPLDKIDPAIVGTDGANVPLGENLTTEWHNIKIGATSKKYFLWSKISPDRAAPTITTVPCIVHPFFPRLLLIRELKRIASFPDDFVLTGGYRRQYERIGRSVPPFMMREIASTIRDQILAKLP